MLPEYHFKVKVTREIAEDPTVLADEQATMFTHLKSILIVDDEPELLGILTSQLENAGVNQLATASSGNEALQLVSEQGFDLIITDLNMQQGDGITVLKGTRLSKMNQKTPVILMSGYLTKDHLLYIQKTNLNVKILTKPFKMEELAKVLEGLSTTEGFFR
jgi:CheY-like chemotaxis protein